MRKTFLASALAMGLLPLLMHSPSANADFITKKDLKCPGNNKTVVPIGSNISIQDVIVSANKNQQVTLKYTPSKRIIMSVYLKANDSVVSNFQGAIEGDNEEAVKLDCAGTNDTKVSVTIVGKGSL